MPANPTTSTDQPTTQPGSANYLVLAADMSTYDGHQIYAYQMVMTRAESEETALEAAAAALDPLGGCVPVTAYTATELHELADALSARELTLGRSYNLSLEMTDEEVAAEVESATVSSPRESDGEFVGRSLPSQQESDAF